MVDNLDVKQFPEDLKLAYEFANFILSTYQSKYDLKINDFTSNQRFINGFQLFMQQKYELKGMLSSKGYENESIESGFNMRTKINEDTNSSQREGGLRSTGLSKSR